MRDRIDCKDKALQCLHACAIADVDELERVTGTLAAQTYAILALAEQQRIANLIALATSAPLTDPRTPSEADLEERLDELRADAKAALFCHPVVAAALEITTPETPR